MIDFKTFFEDKIILPSTIARQVGMNEKLFLHKLHGTIKNGANNPAYFTEDEEGLIIGALEELLKRKLEEVMAIKKVEK